jgi:hypothetical protein
MKLFGNILLLNHTGFRFSPALGSVVVDTNRQSRQLVDITVSIYVDCLSSLYKSFPKGWPFGATAPTPGHLGRSRDNISCRNVALWSYIHDV